jgi:hypothetical protein
MTPKPFQARAKSNQIQQCPAKPEQRKSKKIGLDSLSSLVRIERFQGVMLTPGAKDSFSAPFRAGGGYAKQASLVDWPRYHDF